MNLETYYNNPEAIKALSDQHKTELYQLILKALETHSQEKIRLNTELKMKRDEQKALLEELKKLTGKETLEEMTSFLTAEQADFDKVIIETLTKINELEKVLYSEGT